MRYKFIILFLFISFVSKAQVYQLMPQYGYSTYRMNFDSTIQIPTFCGVPKLGSNKINKGALAFDSCNNTFYFFNPKLQAWDSLKSSAVFKKNIILNADANNRLGYWVNGDTIPVAGLGLDSAFKIITQKAVAPTYLSPLVSISSSPASGNYEIGTNLGTITFSRIFTQRDGGAETSITYKKNGTNLSGNTDIVSSLTSALSYTVTSNYDTGACKNNNLGQLDCTGRIVAGSVTSSSITFTPLPKFYWGYVNSYGAPSNSEILATTGGSSLLTTTKSRTYNVTVSGSNKYIYLAYPKYLNTLTSILMSGFETIDAFTPPFEVNVTNAQGYSQVYYVYMNENPFNAGSTPFVVP